MIARICSTVGEIELFEDSAIAPCLQGLADSAAKRDEHVHTLVGVNVEYHTFGGGWTVTASWETVEFERGPLPSQDDLDGVVIV